MRSSSGSDDDAAWRRPADGAAGLQRRPADGAAGLQPPATDAPPAHRYTGPPPSTPPPPGWRPPVVVQPPPPRRLPDQDQARLDAQEQTARTLTYGVAMVAGAIMLILTLLVCGGWLF